MIKILRDQLWPSQEWTLNFCCYANRHEKSLNLNIKTELNKLCWGKSCDIIKSYCFQGSTKYYQQHLFSEEFVLMCNMLAACVFVLKVRLTGWCGRRWNKLGERMAGAKKRRKMKLLTAVYRTSWSTREQEKKHTLCLHLKRYVHSQSGSRICSMCRLNNVKNVVFYCPFYLELLNTLFSKIKTDTDWLYHI